MLNRITYNILSFIFLLSFVSLQEIAIITKQDGIVKYKKEKSESFQNKINIGMELYNNDLLVTGTDGFIMFAYLDDGSLIKIYKDSKVYVTGDLKNKIIDKKIIIDDGLLKFDIEKQKENEFKVVTPTSVASVKGTTFYVDINDQNDIFYGVDGTVEILNVESNEILILSKHKKIISSDNGTILSKEIDSKDLSYLKQIQQESGIDVEEIENFDDDSGSGTLNESDLNTVQELVINLTNPSGENKKLLIKFIQE